MRPMKPLKWFLSCPKPAFEHRGSYASSNQPSRPNWGYFIESPGAMEFEVQTQALRTLRRLEEYGGRYPGDEVRAATVSGRLLDRGGGSSRLGSGNEPTQGDLA